MRIQVIAADFIASVKTWTRSKGTLFWTLAFPIILILIFGAIFSGMGDVEYTLYVQDLDDSPLSQALIESLEGTGVIKIVNVSSNETITDYIENENDVKRVIVIPKGYEETITASFIDQNASVNISYYFDPSDQTSSQVMISIISNIVQTFNMDLSSGRNIIGIDMISTIPEELGFFDFFLPGMIGFTIMQSCVYGSIERNTKFRKDGILRKLLTTPITRTEWILSKMFFMLFLSFISTSLIIVIGVLLFGVTVSINALMIVIIIATSFLFSGLGMLIGRFVKDEETADTAGGAITFPMMFLAGTFFELEMMPEFLQAFARVLPLYYVNEGLRNAMTYMNQSEAILNAIVVLIFASVFFIAGVLLTKWKED